MAHCTLSWHFASAAPRTCSGGGNWRSYYVKPAAQMRWGDTGEMRFGPSTTYTSLHVKPPRRGEG